jgi:RND family efflux transporter MFP subunit
MRFLLSRAPAGLRLFLLSCLLFLTPALAGPGGPGHSHGPEEAAGPVQPYPRFAAEGEAVQIVGVWRDGALTLWLDRLEDNAPVTEGELSLDLDGRAHRAEPQRDGTWRVTPSGLPASGEVEVVATLSGPIADLLVATLPLGAAEAPHESGLAALLHRQVELEVVLLAAVPAVLAALLLGWSLGRGRRAPVAAALLLLATPAMAGPGGPGHDHGGGAALQPATRSDAPRRLPDGSVFLAKASQRLLDIRTVTLAEGEARRAITLPGRVVSDPNRGGLAQSTVGGRVIPPEGGLPRLGQAVRQGEVLAMVEPPLPLADRTTIAERQGEIAQLIAGAETRLTRARALAASGAGIRAQVTDIEVELEGLRRRRAMLADNRESAEVLRAPVDGVVASAAVVAGQVVQAREMLFQVVDPEALWVEALAFGADAAGWRFGSITASAGAERAMSLRFLGFGRALQQQATLVQFAVEDPPPGLALGQPVQVVAQVGEPLRGILLDRSALVRGANGEAVVWRQSAPERFEAMPVRVESVEAGRVLVVAGLEPGQRIVVRGAGFVNQVR